MTNKQALRKDLIEAMAFHEYVHEFGALPYSPAAVVEHYRNDSLFHRKVDQTVSDIMRLVEKHST